MISIVKFYFISILLLLLSFQDFKNLEVDLFLYIATICFILMTGKYLISFFLIFMILFILNFNKKEGIAKADIILMISCGTHIKIENIGIFLTLTSLIALCYGLLCKKNKIPLIPFISISFFILKLLY